MAGKSIFFLIAITAIQTSLATYITDDVYVSELFSLRIEPRMFNWTFQGLTEQFLYRPSLEGYPDLPSWVRYMYSNEYHSGFLYGTPPEKTADSKVPLEIIALNKQSYETKRIVLILTVHRKLPPRNVIQMKIDNLNWVHMMDPGRIENLKNIFRNDLWQESRSDLHIIFMDSAVKLGARVPLKPQQREGVVVHLGSRADFSSRLLELQEEVKPLYKIASCNYKRTSLQTTFENSGFKLDWCAFKLHAADDDITAMPHHPHESLNLGKGSELSTLHRSDKWDAPMKSEVPERNYSDEFAVSFAIPGMIFALLLSILTVILCFQHEKLQEYRPVQAVQMVQYLQQQPAPSQTATLRSLKDAPYEDTLSLRSSSPTESYYPDGSPRIGNTYLRPKPPPYKPSSANSTMQRKIGTGVDI
ncbi:epsilon-sarcoglycan isoform X2 [Malaya genurostris]|uniref:epsilon-sarcoglycan isoform X2 n=1 Tax=Malaya genurostris TaxID=325434 RepID=UPI0026F38A68|nr:epsilon-sarcoglycan isoform X2 [Malaya genurostris]